MSEMMAALTVEEKYYIGLTLLINRLALKAVRFFFDKTFPSLVATLHSGKNHLSELRCRNVLTKPQWNLLFLTNGKSTSKDFDLTLMICLLRNLTNIKPPFNGFDNLPLPRETTHGSDLARLKWYRNQLAHHDSTTIDTVYFNKAWGNITDAVCRLGDLTMKYECKELEEKIFDQSNLASNKKLLREAIDILGSGQSQLTKIMEQLLADDSHKRKQKEGNEALNRHTGQTFRGDVETGHTNRDYTERGTSPTMPRDSLDMDECKASNRTTGQTPRGDVETGHTYRGYTERGTSPTMPRDSLDMDERKSSNRTTGHTVRENERTRHINSGYTERGTSPTMPRDSLDMMKEKRQRINKFIMLTLISALIVGCICGAVAWLIKNKYFLDSKDPPPTIMTDYPSSPDKCDNDISTATIGEPICIPFTQKFTVNPSRVNITQKSSQYCIALQGFSVNVSSDIFVRQIGDWIIYFNSSRTYQQFRFVKKTATCDSIGIYELSLYNGVDNLTPFEFTIRLKDPTLQQSVTRIYGFIHVHCEMTANCIASSLVLVVNNEPTSKELPDTNVCSNNDMMGGTKLAVDETFRISKLSVNQTISCVPVMKNIELAANLTSTTTVPFCEGDDCVFGCKEESQSISYYSNIDFCDRFYQCSNGILVSHSCGNGTYWSPSECNCDHFDGAICDQKTKRFSKPVTSKKCSP